VTTCRHRHRHRHDTPLQASPLPKTSKAPTRYGDRDRDCVGLDWHPQSDSLTFHPSAWLQAGTARRECSQLFNLTTPLLLLLFVLL